MLLQLWTAKNTKRGIVEYMLNLQGGDRDYSVFAITVKSPVDITQVALLWCQEWKLVQNFVSPNY